MGCGAKFSIFLESVLEKIKFSGLIHGNKRPNFFILEELANQNTLTYPSILGAEITSYSQYGEDVIIDSLLRCLIPERYKSLSIAYCDIGSNHPVNMSNTYLLYKKGMKGVLVEPNTHLAKCIISFRPLDVLVQAAITLSKKEHEYLYIPQYHEIASLNPKFINAYRVQRNMLEVPLKKISVNAIMINNLFEKYFSNREIDILDIDVEGLDFKLLSSINFSKYAPLIICIEPSNGIKGIGLEGVDCEIRQFLKGKGYQQVAETPANMIFIKSYLTD
jgi:FkbM family methyltransferase